MMRTPQSSLGTVIMGCTHSEDDVTSQMPILVLYPQLLLLAEGGVKVGGVWTLELRLYVA